MHGTCVALGGVGALLRGLPGAGKSDLALRFLFLPSERLAARSVLVADDQVILRRVDDCIFASCPPPLAGMIEVRGAGIARLGGVDGEVRLALVADVDSSNDLHRLPDSAQFKHQLGLSVPLKSC